MELAIAAVTLLATVLTAWARMSDQRRLHKPERDLEEEDREIEQILHASPEQRSAYLERLRDKAERSVRNRG